MGEMRAQAKKFRQNDSMRIMEYFKGLSENKQIGVMFFLLSILFSITSFMEPMLLVGWAVCFLVGGYFYIFETEPPLIGFVIAIKGEKQDSYLGTGDTVGVLEEAIIFRDEIRADECITRINTVYGRTTDTNLNTPEKLSVKNITINIV